VLVKHEERNPKCWDYLTVESDLTALDKINLNNKQQVKRCTIISRICSRKAEGITDKIKRAKPTKKSQKQIKLGQ
jgi:hypothetical protein